MTKFILVALIAYLIGSNFWAYPTQDGISFGLGEFGYFYEYATHKNTFED